jgi:hypothetical protein
VIAAWLVAAALADEPVTDVIAPPSDDPYVIVVYGESVILEARARAIGALQDQGYRPRHTRDGWTDFRPPEPWMGRAHLGPDGELTFGRPILKLGEPSGQEHPYSPDATLDRLDTQQQVVQQRFWFLPSGRMLRSREAQVREAAGPTLDRLATARAESHFEDGIRELPGRLDALWTGGAGLDGRTLATAADRRQAVLELWSTRTDTPEGDAIRDVIATWLRHTVQPSADPVTPAEAAAAAAKAGRALDLG